MCVSLSYHNYFLLFCLLSPKILDSRCLAVSSFALGLEAASTEATALAAAERERKAGEGRGGREGGWIEEGEGRRG